MSIDLDAPRCEGCKRALPLHAHTDNDADALSAHGYQTWPDGSWCMSCHCGWEGEPARGVPEPIPSWRTIAPELCVEIERLRGGE